MKRRDFIRGAAGGLLTAQMLPALLAGSTAAAQSCVRRPGVQLFTLREMLQSDPRAALAALHTLGIEELELFGVDALGDAGIFGMPLEAFKSLLEQQSLSTPTAHIGGALTNIAAAAQAASALDVSALIVALPDEFTDNRDGRFTMIGAKSIEQLDRLAQRLDATARELRAHGLDFGYHNHHVEFIELDGIVPFDYLMQNTDPQLVKIELDLGWLAAAGRNPAAYIDRYRERVIACHLKDYAPERGRGANDEALAPQRALVEPGAGTIDWRPTLAAMDSAGVRHGFIEIDVSDDPLGAVERGHRYLQSLSSCTAARG
jgi:sugar phosphate isomerase/epimerase